MSFIINGQKCFAIIISAQNKNKFNMPWFTLFNLIFISHFFAVPAFAGKPGPTFVIDLDHVLIEPLGKTFLKKIQPSRIISDADQQQYYVTKYAAEFVKQLSLVPDAKVFIYSDSPEDRIRFLLKQIHLENSSNQENTLNWIQGIKSRSDILMFNAPVKGTLDDFLYYGDRKKDLAIFHNLENTIIIDDNLGNALPGQEKNFLPIPFDGIEHAQSFESSKSKTPIILDEYDREDLIENYRYYHKLSFAYRLILSSLEEWNLENSSQKSLRNIVFKNISLSVSTNGTQQT